MAEAERRSYRLTDNWGRHRTESPCTAQRRILRPRRFQLWLG